MARTLITMPATAKHGEIIEIRTLIAHPMETSYRVGADGQPVPRNIIRRFVCQYGDETVFSAELFAAVAANPLIVFTTVATASATLTFTWDGDYGFLQRETRELSVT